MKKKKKKLFIQTCNKYKIFVFTSKEKYHNKSLIFRILSKYTPVSKRKEDINKVRHGRLAGRIYSEIKSGF